MVMLKMLMEISLPKMGDLFFHDDDDFPLWEEVPSAESLPWMPKVLLPKFRLETAALYPESPPLIFSRSK